MSKEAKELYLEQIVSKKFTPEIMSQRMNQPGWEILLSKRFHLRAKRVWQMFLARNVVGSTSIRSTSASISCSLTASLRSSSSVLSFKQHSCINS